MKDSRRNFLKKAAIGTAVISSGAGFSALGASRESSASGSAKKSGEQESNIFPGWESSFDDKTSTLTLKNGTVSVQGQVSFISGESKWTPAGSRDRLKNRFTLMNPQGVAQGYFEIHPEGANVRIMFYHRSAQSFPGTFSYSGKITFVPGSFACRTKPRAGEKVLSLSTGRADSMINDSLFAPESDTALMISAGNLRIKTEGQDAYSFSMAGNIDNAESNSFSLILEKDFFRNSYVPYYKPLDRKRCPKAPTGWMSWNTYFDKATAEDNLAEARIGQKYLQPFGCDIWHIESWQGNSDKLPVRNFYNMNLETSKNKFPKGMKKLADDIKKLGFKPGIWMAPFATGNREFYEANKDWFIHDKEGKPVSCWNGQFTVDPTNPEALAHLKHIHEVASKEWGYEYFKIDGMSGGGPSYGAHFYERPEIRAQLKDPNNPNPYELCLKTFREAIGEDRIWLACGGHTTGPDVLYVDAARTGADVVHPDQPVIWAGVKDQGRCTLSRIYTNNIVGYTDPDTLLVHDLTLEESRVATTIIALPGQLTFFADKLAGLTEERMKLLQQTLPVADVLPGNLYPFYSMLPVWNLNVRNSFLGDYNVVGLFNWEDNDSKISFTTTEIGIDPEADYTLYEFWTQKGLGSMKGSFEMEVPAHSVRLLAVHKSKDAPQWISSDRHVAQNAMELKGFEWKGSTGSIEGKISLIGGFPLTMRMHVPGKYKFSSCKCAGVETSVQKESNDILAVTFRTGKTGDYDFMMKF